MSFYPLLRFVPKNHVSYLTGKLAEIQLPAGAQQQLIRWFAARYGADLNEADKELSEYKSLAAFFRRDLKTGLRPVASEVVSPVDGSLEQSGRIEKGRMLQAKDKWYSAQELVGDTELGSGFDDGYYFTFYLAPGDYHHIHSPVSGLITAAVHVPGALWPVNPWSVGAIENLFCINERITTLIDSKWGKVAVVKVGATNVGSITTEYNSFVGNAGVLSHQRIIAAERFANPIPIAAGAKLGSFRMGSTVVVLFEQAATFGDSAVARGKIRLGNSLL